MSEAAIQLAASDYVLRSGGADGADTAFEKGCLRAKGRMEIFLPWSGFNGRQEDGIQYLLQPKELFEEAARIAQEFHPAWSRLSRGAKALMARNSFQVLGPDLKSPTDLIICWTPGGKIYGGTGQALRISKSFNIPIINYGDHYSE